MVQQYLPTNPRNSHMYKLSPSKSPNKKQRWECHGWNFWIDVNSLTGFPQLPVWGFQGGSPSIFCHPTPEAASLGFWWSWKPGGSDLSKGRKGTLQKMLHVFVGKRLKLQKLWWYLNSWLQFYDFNSLLQSSKIVLKVGEPSTKMLSTWSMDCANSIFIKRTSLLFTVYWQFGLVFEVIWASLLKLLTLGLFHTNSNPPLPQTAKPPCFPSITCHTFCQVTIGCWKAPAASWGSRNSTPSSTRQGRYQKASQLQNHVLVVFDVISNEVQWF